jgi:acyl-CoA synthetase (AMP-forming)/AMP-acid ligase II
MILEKTQRIKEYTAKGWWDNTTVDDIFKKNVAKYPEFIALVDPVNRESFTIGAPQRWTFAQMDEKVNQLATAFLEAGLGKDDIIGIFLPNIWELVITYLAIARIGAIANPYPPSLREYEITKMGSFTGIKAMVTVGRFKDRDLAALIRSIQSDIPTLDYLFALGVDDSDKEFSLERIFSRGYDRELLSVYTQDTTVDPNDIFTICWTSGTTGMPKGVPRSHNLWAKVAHASTEGAGINHDYVFLCPFPIVNMGGIGGAMIPWLHTGCRFILHQPFELPVFLKQIVMEKVTYSIAPPALLNILLKNEAILANVDISSLKVLGSGSAPLTPWMIKGWYDKYGIQVTNFFGSNEGFVLLGAPNSIPNLEKRATYFPAFGAVGSNYDIKIVEGMQTKLVDIQTGATITSLNTPGEICIKGPTVFTGYYKAPEANKQVFDEEGFFKTGDVFEMIEDEGEKYYRFVERCKDIIIRGGANIAPATIEALLVDLPKLSECAIVGYPDEDLGERLALFVVPKPDEEITFEEVIAHLRAKKIASYKLPEKLLTIDVLPRNPVGKILRRVLREQVEV